MRVLDADFEGGDFACLRCGKPVHLYFNGGEMDEKTCCGLKYATEIARVELLVGGEDQPSNDRPETRDAP